MFLKFIKDLSIKRVLNNSSDTINYSEHEKKIQTVGVLIDETTFSNKEEVIQKLLDYGISKENLSLWLYWPFRLLIIFPVYQVLLVIIGTIFGQFAFFWEFEKKMLERMKLGFIGKYVDSKLKKEQ